MFFAPRQLSFVLSASHHGTMIVNRNDYNKNEDSNEYYGVGYHILNSACFDVDEISLILQLLSCRRKYYGNGVFVIDGGANIGVHTLECSRYMQGWGSVLSFEAQERIFYALAGNIAINNCTNAQAKLSALGAETGKMLIPRPDYNRSASFGSLELKQKIGTEFIGQYVSYSDDDCDEVSVISLDSLDLLRLDFIKIDVEGMEMDVLQGGIEQICKHHPIILVETLKSDKEKINNFLIGMGYKVFPCGINALAIHNSDPTLNEITGVKKS
ncbi:FkbM family methyltransferase [Citrobacter werkmanii]|uniref:FkbM family methyltransferase n=1 Tax=Citrobacter werkmanii TaxID=67827 RepID=UPI000506DB6A|nr:FkbM family methyltransferase [Citrobacter werkmanii]UCA24017.1 FkbM family methyltransferase [Citrobacter werkmanii]GAL45342.1 putative methyltransferase [Citrobacter werkmanii NBRC 105721]